jgi:hypothetical protein
MARKLEVIISGDSAALERAFKKTSSSARGFGTILGTVAKVAGAAAIGGIAAAGYAIEKMGKAAMEEQVTHARLTATLQAAGIAYKKHADEIEKVVSSEEHLSGFSRDQLTGSLATVARASGSLSEAYKLNALSADVARGRGVDVATAATLVTKAYMGNVGALRRLGIDVQKVTTATDALKNSHHKATEAQKEAAKAADQLATKHELIATLEQKFGGQAEAYGKTAAGAMDRFHNATHDLEVSLGTTLLPTIAAVAGTVADFVTKLESSERLKQIFADIGNAISNAFQNAQPMIKTVADALEKLAGFLSKNIDVILPLAGAVAGMIAAWKAYELVTKAAAIAQGILNVVMTANPIGIVVLAIAGLVGALVVLYERSQTAHKIIDDAFHGIQSIVTTVVNTLKALWDKFGGSITSVAHAAFGALKDIIGGELNVVKGIITTVMALIHGDWGKAWDGLKQIFSGVWQSMTAIIRNFGPLIVHAAEELGKAIIDGIISGLGDIASSIGDKLSSGLHGAIGFAKGALGISSPSKVTHQEIGKPLAEGVIEGWLEGSAQLPDKMSKSIRRALEAAKQAVDSMRGEVSTAFSQLSNDALSSFDAIWANVKTPAEKALAALDKKDLWDNLNKNITDARNALNDALAGGDPAAVTAAQKQLEDALTAVQRQALIDRAAEERKQLDARVALRRRHFEEELADLQDHFAKTGESHKRAQIELLALLKKFGVDYRIAGNALGTAFSEGLRESIQGVAAAVDELAQKLRQITTDFAGKSSSVGHRAGGGPVLGGSAYIVGENGPELFIPGLSGSIVPNHALHSGGSPVATDGARMDISGDVIFEVDGEVLGRVARREILRAGGRNVTAGLT